MKATHIYYLNQNTSRQMPFSGTRRYSHTLKKVYEVRVEYIGPSKTKGWVIVRLPNNLMKSVKETQIKEINI